jgi:cell division GTPase FtsZ
MLQAKVIGIGAAGNKAAIKLIEEGIMQTNDVLLLNSTLKDVPAAYKEYAIEFKGATKGCAKERNLAGEMAMENLRNGDINLDGFLSPEDHMVIIVNSSEGGTGCGASTVLAKYFKEVLGANVHMFVFTGFEEDARGLKNTVEYFKDLAPTYVVEAISNKKFLDECNGNKIKAEAAANEEFVKRISILLGKTIVESEQNIDDLIY